MAENPVRHTLFQQADIPYLEVLRSMPSDLGDAHILDSELKTVRKQNVKGN